MRAALAGWGFDREQLRPAVAPTIPHHCSDDFNRGCADLAREFAVGLHSHVGESKVQAVTGIRRYGMTHRKARYARRARPPFHGGARGLARR
jgi:guanine deaminase